MNFHEDPKIDAMIRQLAENVKGSFDDPLNIEAEAALRWSISLSIGILTRYPDLYKPENILKAPVGLFGDQVVMARTREFGAKINLESIAALEAHPALLSETLAMLTDELATELRRERDDLAANGRDVAMYVPVIVEGPVVDPTTFEPGLRFKTRYGVIEG